MTLRTAKLLASFFVVAGTSFATFQISAAAKRLPQCPNVQGLVILTPYTVADANCPSGWHRYAAPGVTWDLITEEGGTWYYKDQEPEDLGCFKGYVGPYPPDTCTP